MLAFGFPDYSPKDTFKNTGTQRDAMPRDFPSEHNVLHLWTLPDVVDNHVATGQKGLIDYAEALTLDGGTFRSCLESGKHKPEIQSDIQVAASLQINATPSFLIGKITGDEVSGAIVLGALPFNAFEAKLKEAEFH